MKSGITEQQRQALKMAAGWFATLCAGDATPQQHARWQQWHQQNDIHRWAWQRVESLQSQLQKLPGDIGYRTLNQAHLHTQQTRRRVLKSMLLLLGVGGSWQLWRSPAAVGLRADYHTMTGETRRLTLQDGSTLMLNTASAVQVSYSDSQRLIYLIQGEIAITTATDAQARPFLVATRQGVLRALGTEFSVRQWDGSCGLAVQQHAVEVRLSDRPDEPHRVDQGQMLRFSQHHFEPLRPLNSTSDSWTQGVLSVSNRRLAEVLDEVARYRPGRLDCADDAADLRVSGTWPLQDTDRLLTVLAQTLPIKIHTFSRYWVRVSKK